MTSTFQFQDELNPKIWSGDALKPMVRLKLFQAAVAFYKFLDVERLVVKDIILTGSNAAFNYTKLSDLDVHLVVDFSHGVCPELADNFFTTKKALWGETYDVTIYGLPVELYVEDKAEPVKATGIYSILHNKWLKQPSPERPSPDDDAVRQKRDAYASKIEDVLSGEPTIKDIDRLIRKLRTMRSSGLERGGEFSNENIAYKSLRDHGYIKNLYDKRVALRDKELSLQ